MRKWIVVLGCILSPFVLQAEQNWKAILRYDKQAAKTALTEHLSKYAAQDSSSAKQQTAFAKNLAKELKHIGASNVQITKTGIVTADIPATSNKSAPTLALIAHLDTPSQTLAQQPQSHLKYTRDDISLDKSKNISLTEENSPQLLRAHGHDFLTSNGSAAFGATSKAGLAIVMTLADYLLGHTSIQHGPIKIVLLPNTSSHVGASALDVQVLGADYAYILDGTDASEVATENFNGNGFTIVFEGKRDVTLGKAMGSSFADNLLMASDFHTLLPRHLRPDTTSGRQGYIMVDEIITKGNRSTITGHLRAFTEEDLQGLSQQVTRAFNTVKALYPKAIAAELTFQPQFKNVKSQIPATVTQPLELAFYQEDMTPKYISVRDNTDFAVLTSRGLPTISIFTGVFHGAEPLEYVDVDIMEMALRGLFSAIVSK